MGNWRHWLHGLLGASISTAATAVSTILVDPVQFNLTDGLPKLLQVVTLSAVVGAVLYLKQSPLPPEK